MSCKKCSDSEKDLGITYYRWGQANIGMTGCQEHLREVFEALNAYQMRKVEKARPMTANKRWMRKGK
jgi:hypothetical protein